ncbi:hypothetical protein HDU79_003232 [Rhizoclosmatium sp. JEL0117]|nr:hypothetical protein HDU79_003232 [Rhizoclosmatium sp. JEL0117]
MTLEPIPTAANVEASGFTASDIDPSLFASVSRYNSLEPTSLIGYANDSLGGIFVKRRVNRSDGRNGSEMFRIVENREVSQVTDLCSGDNLGANLYTWKSVKSGAVFLRDVDGCEAPDLWEGVLDAATKKWLFSQLTDNKSQKVKCGSIVVSQDELTLVFTWNKRDPKCSDIYTWKRASASVPWKESQPVLAYKSTSGMMFPASFLKDGRLVLVHSASPSKNDTFFGTINENGEITEPLTHFKFPGVDETKQIRVSGLSKSDIDPEIVYVTSNAYSDTFTLVEINHANNTVRHITTPDEDSLIPSRWDVGDFISVGSNVLFSFNENGKDIQYALDVPSWTIRPLPDFVGVISKVCVDRRNPETTNTVSYSVNTPSHPSLLYELNLETMQRTEYQVGVSKLADESNLSVDTDLPPELITFKSFDGLEISAFMYLPPPSKATSKIPVLVYVHGGPTSQYRPTYLPGSNALSMRHLTNEMGIACICPNIRGSTGYGTSFMEADDRLKRKDALKDIESLVHWIKSQPQFDDSRVAIMGRSYGGWATLAALVFFPDLFKCGLATCGISNYLTFFENTGPWRADNRRKEYGDERIPEEREFLLEISPALHADKIRVPVFLGIGENDTRVPLGEAVSMGNVLEGNGNTVWLMVGKKEGHMFKQRSVKDFHGVASAAFLQKFLL